MHMRQLSHIEIHVLRWQLLWLLCIHVSLNTLNKCMLTLKSDLKEKSVLPIFIVNNNNNNDNKYILVSMCNVVHTLSMSHCLGSGCLRCNHHYHHRSQGWLGVVVWFPTSSRKAWHYVIDSN